MRNRHPTAEIGCIRSGSRVKGAQAPEFSLPVLRVRGHSMRDAGILDGDLLAVHSTKRVENSDIVVAWVNDEEVTVKRFHRRSAYLVRLLPENPDFDPIELDLRNDTLVIERLGVGVLRSGI